MLRRQLLQMFGWLPFGFLWPPSSGASLTRINASLLQPILGQGTCAEDVCTQRDMCESGDAGHVCQQRDMCDVDQSGDCTVDDCVNDSSGACQQDSCQSDSSNECQEDVCSSDSSGQCEGDRCVSDGSGDCIDDGGPTCPPEDPDCLTDTAGTSGTDASGACTHDRCLFDLSGSCEGDGCTTDRSGSCGGDFCVSDSSGACSPSDVCTSDGSKACVVDSCQSDSSGSCEEDLCTSDAGGECSTRDDCVSDASSECQRDTCQADSSGACGVDICVLDSSGSCDSDLCRDDRDSMCEAFDTCSIDRAPGTAQLLNRRSTLNRAIRWLYGISAGLLLCVMLQAGPSPSRAVIDATLSVQMPRAEYQAGVPVNVASSAGPFLMDFDGDGVLEADVNGNGFDAGDPEVRDLKGEGLLELPAGTVFQGNLQYLSFWIPNNVYLRATGPLNIRSATDIRIFGLVRLAQGAVFSARGVVDLRSSAWVSDAPDTSEIRFTSALSGEVREGPPEEFPMTLEGFPQDSDLDGLADSVEGTRDEDGDGVADWLDQDTASMRLAGSDGGPVLEISEGANQRLDFENVRQVPADDPSLNQAQRPPGLFPFGLAAGDIVGISVGETVALTLRYPLPVPTLARFWLYDSIRGWRMVTPEDHDGDTTLVLRLTDGGDMDADGAADGRIQFQGGPLFFNLLFAQFGDGGDLLFSQILLLNPGTGATTAQLVLRNDSGNPLEVDLNGEIVGGSTEVQIPASGLRYLETDGRGPVRSGGVQAAASRELAGVILFGGTSGLAGVGNSPTLPQGFLAPMETNVGEGVNTGVALMNLSDREATLQLKLMDPDGAQLAQAEAQVPRLGHSARFVDQFDWDAVVDFTQFLGLLRVTSSENLAATVLQTRPGEFATLPAIPLREATPEAEDLYFAQFGDGQGLLSSQIVLFNLDPTTEAQVTLTLRNDAGQSLAVDLNGSPVQGQFTTRIPPGGLRSLRTDGLGAIAVGSVIASSPQPIAGVILFGGSVGVAGVGSSQAVDQGFRAPIETRASAGLNTGLAIVNLESRTTSLLIELLDMEGRIVAASTRDLPRMGHLSIFIDQFSWNAPVNFTSFRGVVRVTPSRRSRFAATVIQQRPGQFATLPVLPLAP